MFTSCITSNTFTVLSKFRSAAKSNSPFKIGSFSEYYNYISIFEKDVTARIKSFYQNGINYMDRIEISTGEFIERIYDRKTINENGMGVKEKITAWHNNGIKAASVTELGFGRKGIIFFHQREQTLISENILSIA